MRRSWVILIICCTLTAFVYYSSHQKPDTLPAAHKTIDHKDIFRWIAHRRDYQQMVRSVNTTPVLNPKSACHSDPLLLVVICSKVSNFIRRRTIRDTWAKDASRVGNVEVYFLVGSAHNISTARTLQNEVLRYRDIIQYDFVESYYNLTLKSVLLLKWVVHYCQTVHYVMKADDDVFVHLPNLVNYLKKSGQKTLMIGTISARIKPIKNPTSKWYVPIEEYAEPMYPDYLTGGAYVLGQKAASLLYNTALDVPFIRIEDVYITGLCARSSGLKPQNHDGFLHIKLRNNPCYFRNMFTVHGMSVVDMYSVWSRVFDPSYKCRWWSKWVR